jgi:hypothetical protein
MDDSYDATVVMLTAAGWTLDDARPFPWNWVHPTEQGEYNLITARDQYLLERDLAAYLARTQS